MITAAALHELGYARKQLAEIGLRFVEFDVGVADIM